MKNIFLIYGTEQFLIDKQVKMIKSKLLGDKADENTSVYDLLTTPISEVVDDLLTIPFFADKKIVVAKNPYFLTGKKNKSRNWT